jgi:hypothetical protein
MTTKRCLQPDQHGWLHIYDPAVLSPLAIESAVAKHLTAQEEHLLGLEQVTRAKSLV